MTEHTHRYLKKKKRKEFFRKTQNILKENVDKFFCDISRKVGGRDRRK